MDALPVIDVQKGLTEKSLYRKKLFMKTERELVSAVYGFRRIFRDQGNM